MSRLCKFHGQLSKISSFFFIFSSQNEFPTRLSRCLLCFWMWDHTCKHWDTLSAWRYGTQTLCSSNKFYIYIFIPMPDVLLDGFICWMKKTKFRSFCDFFWKKLDTVLFSSFKVSHVIKFWGVRAKFWPQSSTTTKCIFYTVHFEELTSF